MSTDVDAAVAMDDRPRNAAERGRLFKHQDSPRAFAFGDELVRGGQPSGASADDNSRFS